MLWLVGMMGSGKSTVGEEVAERLGVGFVDMDAELEQKWGSIALQWASEGEAAFRRREESLIAELASEPTPAVIATGGGVITSKPAIEMMRSSGTVVWLRAATDTLSARLNGAPRRPILGERKLEELSSERLALYEAAAHHMIETDARTADEVIEEVSALWNG